MPFQAIEDLHHSRDSGDGVADAVEFIFEHRSAHCHRTVRGVDGDRRWMTRELTDLGADTLNQRLIRNGRRRLDP